MHTSMSLRAGNLLNSRLLEETCGFDMLPLFRLVYSQIALACLTLSQAVKAAGTPQVSIPCRHPGFGTLSFRY